VLSGHIGKESEAKRRTEGGENKLKKYREQQCPTCRFNNSNFACMNSKAIYQRVTGSHVDWSPFEGVTNRKCDRYEKKEGEKTNNE